MHGVPLELNVIVTTLEATQAALETAAELALGRNAQINLILAHVVPYPLPIGNPAVPVVFTASWLHELASSVAGTTRVQVFLCRDRWRALIDVVKPKSWLVIGARKSWWPTWEERLAQRLQANGHPVILAPPANKESIKQILRRVLQFQMPNSSL